MLRTLRSRLLLYFIIVSLGGIMLVSFAIQLAFQDGFNNYLQLKREEKVKQVVKMVEREFEQYGVGGSSDLMMLLHQQAMTENLFYQVYDGNNRLVAETTKLAGMMNMLNGGHMMTYNGSSPESLNPSRLELSSTRYPLAVNSEPIGFLQVFYDSGYLETDFQFLDLINKYILGAMLTMTGGAVLLSLLFSHRLTSGLRRLRDGARELKSHNLAVRIPVGDGQPEEMVELATAFNDLAQSLSRQEKLRKQFSSDLAHELRTPLATLRSQLEAFQDGIWEPTPVRLKQSHHELMRLVRLVDDGEKLLAAENPQIKLNKEPLEAGQMLRSLQEHFLPAFREKGVDLQLTAPAGVSWFPADKDRFMQIMINLINNALKYTPPGGQVVLATVREKGMITFQVQDTGKGISQEDLPHVLERFYRGDKSRDRKTGGAGIGLSIVQALVQAHQGQLQLASEPDRGTIVTVFFPLHLENARGWT